MLNHSRVALTHAYYSVLDGEKDIGLVFEQIGYLIIE